MKIQTFLGSGLFGLVEEGLFSAIRNKQSTVKPNQNLIPYTLFNIGARLTNNTAKKYMLFTSREVRIGKNCARRLEYRPRP